MDSTKQERIRRFWKAYGKFLLKRGIAEESIPYYLRWARWDTAAYPRTPLRKRGAGDVTSFLQRLSNKAEVSDEQLDQAVDALRQLKHFIRSSLARELPWQELRHSIRPVRHDEPANREKAEPEATPPWASILVSEARRRAYPRHTEQAYLCWLKRLCRRFSLASPEKATPADLQQFFRELATRKDVSADAWKQALGAFSFFFGTATDNPEKLTALEHLPVPRGLVTYLGPHEAEQLLGELKGTTHLIASLIYHTGLRLGECTSLRVGDVDLEHLRITVRQETGEEERVITFPSILFGPLKAHLQQVKKLHQADLARNLGEAPLPKNVQESHAGEEKEWQWQWLFPGNHFSKPDQGDSPRREPVDHMRIQKAVTRAAARLGMDRRVSCRTLRHSFAIQLLKQGTDIQELRAILGHANLSSTMIYSLLLNQGPDPLEGVAHKIAIGQ
jgi:integrase